MVFFFFCTCYQFIIKGTTQDHVPRFLQKQNTLCCQKESVTVLCVFIC